MSGTTKAGGIFAVVNFLAGLAMGFLFPLCFPLCGLVFGAGAGYLGAMWSRESTEPPARVGAMAGAIAGIGALVGVSIGMLVTNYFFGAQNQEMVSELLGLETPTGAGAEAGALAGSIGITCCIGLGSLILGAAGGAGGAAIQSSMSGGKAAAA